MNFLVFDESTVKEIDGNFVSIYNKKEDKYSYFVQRLVGISIENEKDPAAGKMWMVYLNNKRLNWDDVCNNDTKVSSDDEILWNYQNVDEVINRSDNSNQ